MAMKYVMNLIFFFSVLQWVSLFSNVLFTYARYPLKSLE